MKSWKTTVRVTNVAAIALLVGLLMPCGLALGQPFEIPMGTATVDGDLGEWSGANWIDMDQVYFGAPTDLSGAKWTARWTAEMIYVAVTGVDTDHVFNATHQGWNGQDSVEIYVDPANKDTSGFNDTFADAQQYVGSPDGTPGGEWLMLANDPLPPDTVPAFETGVDGEVINYEIAIKPYDVYDRNNPAASTLVTLSTGMTIGLDVVMDTKHAGGFGMLCENTDGVKYANAAQFRDHTLVGGSTEPIPGDANLDDIVNDADAAILATNWQRSGVTWGQGDFNADSTVNDQDAAILATHWQESREATTAAVPEPSTIIALLGMVAVALLGYPYRKRG